LRTAARRAEIVQQSLWRYGDRPANNRHVRTLIFSAALLLASSLVIRAQEESASPAGSYPEVPKEYEVGEDTISPDGRFALLYPVRNEDSDAPLPPNVLVRLKPYAVLKEIEGEQGPSWRGMRGEPKAKWNGDSMVVIWHAHKWGAEDFAIYEIENDKVKRVQKIWPQVVKYFDRDFHSRFLTKYPKESDSYTFVADDSSVQEIEFKDHKLLLNIFADNKPNLAGGPHWTAELHAIWNVDTGKFDKVDFRPGKITTRQWQ
jgi:hypothetical protein